MATKTCGGRLASMKVVREVRGDIADLYHANINVLNHDTLESAMEYPKEYPDLTARISGYTVNSVRLTREQQLDVLSCMFHAGK